jgi:hypothetical protein
MPLSNRDFWKDRFEQVGGFPDHVLVDIARNDAAERRYRLFAVEVLAARKSPKLKHPELRELVHELEIELEGIEFVHPAPSGLGPLVASVTTETMNADFQDPISTPEIPVIPEVVEEPPAIVDPPAAEATNDLDVPPADPVPAKRPRKTKPVQV